MCDSSPLPTHPTETAESYSNHTSIRVHKMKEETVSTYSMQGNVLNTLHILFPFTLIRALRSLLLL